MLRLYNTLTRKKEQFKPISPGKAGLYHCGLTVYDFAHIGNLRAYVFADILRRTLEWNGYNVKQVINITDVGHLTSDADEGEDKMTLAIERSGKPVSVVSMREVAKKYTEAFIEDLKALNIEQPDVLPKASEHISEQIRMIKGLEEKGFIYTTSDGVYFNTSKFPNYGKLGGQDKKGNKKSRVAENPQKKNPADFALWKFNSEMGWDSPWGKGFPGWHIECSAMSMKYLGNRFDIHTGGIDHIGTHHNNEIAQSEGLTGEPFVNYWLHNAFVTTGKDAKMAKSEGTGITLGVLREKSFSPIDYRYWLLTAHYRSPVSFSWEALEAAQNAHERLKTRFSELPSPPALFGILGAIFRKFPNSGSASKYLKRFTEAINDDLNTPEALAVIWDMFKDDEISDKDKHAVLLEFDKVLGLGLDSVQKKDVPREVMSLVKEREKARKSSDWKRSDELRDEISRRGYSVKDTPIGPVVNKKGGA